MKIFTCLKILKAKTEKTERRNNQIHNHSEIINYNFQKLVKPTKHNTSVKVSNSDKKFWATQNITETLTVNTWSCQVHVKCFQNWSIVCHKVILNKIYRPDTMQMFYNHSGIKVKISKKTLIRGSSSSEDASSFLCTIPKP